MSATTRAGPGVAPSRAGAFDPRDGVAWRIALAVLLIGTAAMMWYLTRGLTFNLDEWAVVTERRGPGAPSLLEPHNEHLSVLLLAVFLGLVQIGGLEATWLLMVPLVALQVTLGTLLFVVARRRVGAGVAVGVAAFALLSGLAYENFLIPGQAGQMGSIVAGVGAFALLDLPRTRRTDVGLAALVAAALASSGLGLPVLLGVALELALTTRGRERLWTVAVPFALYLAWYAAYGTNRAGLEEVGAGTLWALAAVAHAAGALVGERQLEPGRDLLVVLLAILAWRAYRLRGAGRVRLAALAALLASFYGLTAISRHDIAPPSSSRYLTVGIVFGLLMLVEAARGWRIRAWVPFAVLALAWVSFAKADGNAQALRDGRALFLQRSERMRASLGAVALLGPRRVAADFEIAPRAAPFLEAGPWFAARDALRGDPALAPVRLPRAPADARAFADDTLVRAGGLRIEPAGRAPRPCEPLGHAPVPAAGVFVRAPAKRTLTLRARRFGPDPVAVGVLPLPPGHAVRLRPQRDASPLPYRLSAPGAARVCRLDR